MSYTDTKKDGKHSPFNSLKLQFATPGNEGTPIPVQRATLVGGGDPGYDWSLHLSPETRARFLAMQKAPTPSPGKGHAGDSEQLGRIPDAGLSGSAQGDGDRHE